MFVVSRKAAGLDLAGVCVIGEFVEPPDKALAVGIMGCTG